MIRKSSCSTMRKCSSWTLVLRNVDTNQNATRVRKPCVSASMHRLCVTRDCKVWTCLCKPRSRQVSGAFHCSDSQWRPSLVIRCSDLHAAGYLIQSDAYNVILYNQAFFSIQLDQSLGLSLRHGSHMIYSSKN